MLCESLHGRLAIEDYKDTHAPREVAGRKYDDLEAILRYCLRTNPASRYASAGELRDDLTAYINHRQSGQGGKTGPTIPSCSCGETAAL